MLLANFNGKEHLRHRAVSLRQHGFLVLLDFEVSYMRATCVMCSSLVMGEQVRGKLVLPHSPGGDTTRIKLAFVSHHSKYARINIILDILYNIISYITTCICVLFLVTENIGGMGLQHHFSG